MSIQTKLEASKVSTNHSTSVHTLNTFLEQSEKLSTWNYYLLFLFNISLLLLLSLRRLLLFLSAPLLRSRPPEADPGGGGGGGGGSQERGSQG